MVHTTDLIDVAKEALEKLHPPVADPVSNLLLRYELSDIVFTPNTISYYKCKDRRIISMVYPLVVELIHRVRTGKTRLIHEDVFASETVVGTVLDEESTENLIKMLSSSDAGNHEVAKSILYQVNIRASWYYIWKISQSSGAYTVNYYGRNKNGRYSFSKANMRT